LAHFAPPFLCYVNLRASPQARKRASCSHKRYSIPPHLAVKEHPTPTPGTHPPSCCERLHKCPYPPRCSQHGNG